MTNLENMKSVITKQINNMNAGEFEQFVEILKGNYPGEGLQSISLKEMFDCDTCRSKYGNCHDGDETDVCSKRFAQFAGMKCE